MRKCTHRRPQKSSQGEGKLCFYPPLFTKANSLVINKLHILFIVFHLYCTKIRTCAREGKFFSDFL